MAKGGKKEIHDSRKFSYGLICGTLGGGPRMHCDLTQQSAFIVRCNKRNALEKIDLNLTNKF